MHEARFYEKRTGSRVRCGLCRQACLIGDGGRGLCGVRVNRGGFLYTLVYGRVIAENVDPVEKKPLYHFLPGSRAYSIGTAGCNFTCSHCQNADISRAPADSRYIAGRDRTPGEIVQAAADAHCDSIAYTYTEPTIFYEFAADVAACARERGIFSLFISNGYIAEKPLRSAAHLIDAANIDLKSCSDTFYKNVCGARLAGVMETIAIMKKLDIWIEITTLIIPGLNDTEGELRSLARFIRGIGADTPWHISRFYPVADMPDRPPTDPATLHTALRIGREEGLQYVYEGNLREGAEQNTRCPGCGAAVIERSAFGLLKSSLREGACPECGGRIAGTV